MQPKVFISHTSRERAPEELARGDKLDRHLHRKRYLKALINALVIALRERELEAWVDQRQIQPADDFQPAIALALATSEAALLLVDRDALRADFMRSEAVFLGWRSVIEPDFQLIPVLLGGVTELEFAKSRLGRAGDIANRCSALTINGKANAKTAGAHATEIAHAVSLRPQRDPVTKRWVEDMGSFLRGLDAPQQHRAARILNIDDEAWARTHDKTGLLAAAFLHASLVEAHAAFREIKEFLPPEQRRPVGERLRPLWVDLSKATSLMADQRPGRTLGIGTGSLPQAEQAIQRGTAHRSETETPHLSTPADEDTVAGLMAVYDETLRRALNFDASYSAADIEESIEDARMLVFALLDCAGLHPSVMRSVVAQLRVRFPGVVFGLVAPGSGLSWHAIRGRKLVLSKSSAQERRDQYLVRQIEQLMEI